MRSRLLMLTLLLIMLMVLNVAAQVGGTTILVIRDDEVLTVYAETPEALYALPSISFQIMVDGDAQVIQFMTTYANFAALDLSLVRAPACFVLRAQGSTNPLPILCQNLPTQSRHIQDLTPRDQFWQDTDIDQPRVLVLLQNDQPIDLCPAQSSECSITVEGGRITTLQPQVLSPTATSAEPQVLPTERLLTVEQYYDRAEQHYNFYRINAALEDINRVIQLDPTFGLAYALRARIYSVKNELNRAFEDANYAVELAPGEVDALLSRAGVYTLLRDFQAAQADLDQALAINPQVIDIYIQQGFFYAVMLNDLDAARDQAEQAELLDPESADVFGLWGYLAGFDSNWSSAINNFSEAIERNPADFASYSFRGVAHWRSNNAVQAERDFFAAIGIAPEFPEPYSNLAVLYLSINRCDLVEDALQRYDQAAQAISPQYGNQMARANFQAQVARQCTG